MKTGGAHTHCESPAEAFHVLWVCGEITRSLDAADQIARQVQGGDRSLPRRWWPAVQKLLERVADHARFTLFVSFRRAIEPRVKTHPVVPSSRLCLKDDVRY
jgi:hypothetical protein